MTTMKKHYRLTQDGVTELDTELQSLVAERSAIADRIKTAREFGDLAENFEYSASRQEQERNEARISELEAILQNVEIIEAPKNGGSKVVLGSTVTLKNGTTKKFQVVGTVEADPLNGKISDESPIGQAMLGKKVGDTVEIKTPADTTTYTITEIA
jgi:transcription elongation factor GreA